MLTRRIVHGIVISRSKGKLHITPADNCGQQPECGENCTSCGGKSPVRRLLIATPDADKFPPGSHVTVETCTPNEAVGALLVFGIPLFFATAALLLRYYIDPSTVESPVTLISAGCAFAAGFAVVGLIDRQLRRKYPASVSIDTAAPPPPVPLPDEVERHG